VKRLWLVAALAVTIAGPAAAWKRTTAGAGGPCLFWSTRGHTYMIDARGTPDVPANAAFDAIRRSFQTWAGVSCSDLIFPDLGISQDPADRRVGYVQGAYNRNLVLWRTANCQGGGAPPNDPCLTAGGCGNKYDCWDHDDQVIAVTTTTFNRTTGQIYDADIELNGSPHSDGTKFQFTANDGPPCSTEGQTGCVRYDIQNTVTHESGHSIGLDHSLQESATMYAYAPEGDVGKRTLDTDDVEAICTIYPRNQPTSTCLGDPVTLTQTGSGEAGGCGCSTRGNGAPLGALLAGVGLWWLRRKARR
jgi:MYXO-CTERM domain-containing protein